MTIEKCVVQGCEKDKRRNGPKSIYCHMHYRRVRLTGIPGEPKEKKVSSYKNKKCRIDECEKRAEKKELCVKHYDDSRNSSLDAETIYNMKKRGCEVCGSFERLTLDHDHSCCPTGKSCSNCVRGILCHKCNTAAGLLNDNIERMFSLASYIMKNKAEVNV